jgi:hypothetical protein
MKTIGKFMLLVAIVAVGFGCEHTPNIPTPPDDMSCIGLEVVAGVVSNENGELLEGIRIDVYMNEKLTEYFLESWENWFAMDEEMQKEYPEKEPNLYTAEDGSYAAAQPARYGVDFLDVYVVATDTTGIYERQVKKGQIKYVVVPIVDDQTGVTGAATVDFVLKKKQ